MREVLIADDHPLFRDVLKRAVLQALTDARLFEAVGVPMLHAVVDTHPDRELLYLDLHMPGATSFSAHVHIRGQPPGLPIITVSAHEEAGIIRRAIAHGASGCIPKSAPVDTVVTAVHKVLEGDLWIPASVHGAGSAMKPDKAGAASRVAELTP